MNQKLLAIIRKQLEVSTTLVEIILEQRIEIDELRRRLKVFANEKGIPTIRVLDDIERNR